MKKETKKTVTKNKVGRPTKLTKKVLDILNEIVEDAIYLTDEDLIFLLNEKLEEKEQLAIQTFIDYKAGRRQANSPIIKEFAKLIKKALMKEKVNLLEKLKEGENGWQAKAWILERKFKEWNLKQISESNINQKTEHTGIVFQNASNQFELGKDGEPIKK